MTGRRDFAMTLTAALCLFAGFVEAQESASLFQAAQVVAGPETNFRAALDYDGDGFADALSAMTVGNAAGPFALTLAGFRNDGAGKLSPDWSLNFTIPLAYPTTVEALDLNGDGMDDFIIAVGPAVSAWVSNGAGAPPTPWWGWTDPTLTWIEDLALADFDLDSDMDFATVGDGFVRVFTLAGGAAPVLASSMPTGTAANYRLVIADVDGLGADDVVVFRSGANGGNGPATTSTYPISAGGVLAAPSVSTTGFGRIAGVAGDLDGDGDVDLLVTTLGIGFPNATRHRFERTGPATFVLTTQADTGQLIGRLADLDLDGDLDGISPEEPASAATTGSSETVGVTFQDGVGDVTDSLLIPYVNKGGAAGLADLDHDGDLDWLMGRCVFYFDPAVRIAYRHHLVPNVPVNTADIDADGDLDLNVTRDGALRNNGSGGFAYVAAPIPAFPGTLYGAGVPLDADGDGDTDVAVNHYQSQLPTPTWSSRLLVNRGDGTWLDGGPATTTSFLETGLPGSSGPIELGPDTSMTGDWDADGDVDLLVWTNSGSYHARPWFNDGAGFFTPGAPWPAVRPVLAADFDGDGHTDVMVNPPAGFYPPDTGFYRGLGGGAFAAPGAAGGLPLLSTSGAPFNFPAAGDVDGDGDLDVYGFELGGPKLWLNNGAGTFTATPSPIGAPWYGVVESKRTALIDVDADGDLDLLSALASSAVHYAVALGNGSGGFETPRIEAADFLSFADVDGDGDADLVGPQRITLNRRFRGASAGRRLQYGAGTAGTGGAIPNLGESGPLRSGHDVTFRVAGARGGAVGLFGVGVVAANLPLFGSTLWAYPDQVLPLTTSGAPGAAGAGTWELTWSPPASLAGFVFFHQVVIADPAGPQGLAWSNGLELGYGS